MSDVVSHRDMNIARTESAAGAIDAPTESVTELGPNPFEESWNAEAALRPQSDDSFEESDAGLDDATALEASDEVEADNPTGEDEEQLQVQQDEEDLETEPTDPVIEALKLQNQQLIERIARLEAQGQEPTEPEIDMNLSWDGLQVDPLPEELGEYDEALTKRMTQIAEHVWGFAQRQAQQQAELNARAEAQNSLKTQINEMVADPAFADVDVYFPAMKELAAASPALLYKPGGLKAIYYAAKGTAPPAAQKTPVGNGDEGFARGVKAGLQKVQSKRTSSTAPPRKGASGTTPVRRSAARTLQQAMNEEFAAAREAALRR